jgi:Flp pilus assembly protein CpaB
MDDQLRTILIIIVSVSIFGLLVFVFVKNVIRNRIKSLTEEEEEEKKLK